MNVPNLNLYLIYRNIFENYIFSMFEDYNTGKKLKLELYQVNKKILFLLKY